ncbi:MAG: hypothetical protein IT449_15295 [Phycisphaerales bacterium]|nr:hypothetical protein [Phycisphaerales bacterium]
MLFVTGAPPLPGTSPPASWVAVWRDYDDAQPYVFARRIYTHTDLGHALLRLETLLGVDRAQFTSNSSLLADSVTLALAAPPDATTWPLATHGQIAVALGFDASDISDPTFLLADDDHGGDLDSEDECHNNSFTTGMESDYGFMPTELLTLDDLAIELTYGTDCCGTSACCDNTGQCGQNQHCADGECVPDECNGPGDCPDGSHCEGGECVDDPCSGSGECPPGQECIGGECEKRCDGDDDCPSGDECVGGVCEDCPGVCCDAADCGDGNYCTIDSCSNGACYHFMKNCSEGDKCTDDHCDPLTGNCDHTAKCDDENPCTIDTCDPETGVCTHSCLDDCTACEDGLCVLCGCVEAGCSVTLDVEPQEVCSGGILEVTLVAECHPDCGNGALQFLTDPPDAEITWIEPPPPSIDCDGQQHTLILLGRPSCEERGFVRIIAELVSPGDQHCEDDALTEVFQCPDVDMDSNRDGVVSDSDDDEEGEDSWQYGASAKGAIVLVNCDADGGAPPIRDLDDSLVNSVEDVADLSELIIRPVPPAGLDGWKRRLRIPDNDSLRVFPALTDQAQAILGPGQETYVIQDALDAELHYGIESIIYPGDRGHSQFDGLVNVHVDLMDEQDIVWCTDKIQVRVAPFILLPNTAPPHKILVSDTDSELREFVETHAGSNNTRTIPHDVCPDRFPQDAWEFGFSSRPLGTSTSWNLWEAFETLYGIGPLQDWGRTNLLGSVRGVPGNRLGLLVRLLNKGEPGYPPTNEAESFAYGGNLDVIPPFPDHPLGKVVVGTMPQVQVDFLNKQQVQSPLLQLDTTWLLIGHLDEILAFVPDSSGFAIAIASPSRARQVINIAADYEPLFYDDPNDTVYYGVADNNPGLNASHQLKDTTQRPVDFSAVKGWYVRIYDGFGRHQFARIGQESTVDTIEIESEYVWRIRDAAEMHDAIARQLPPSPMTLYSRAGSWFPPSLPNDGYPNSTSRYVIKQYPQYFRNPYWLSEIPALITSFELREDDVLWDQISASVQAKIDIARQELEFALNGCDVPVLEVPSLYLANSSGPSSIFGQAFAYTPGAANLQVWDDQLWLPCPFGPRPEVNGATTDLLLDATRDALDASEIRASYFVDDWDFYHMAFGEVHCATNVVRIAPTATFDRWWEIQP